MFFPHGKRSCFTPIWNKGKNCFVYPEMGWKQIPEFIVLLISLWYSFPFVDMWVYIPVLVLIFKWWYVFLGKISGTCSFNFNSYSSSVVCFILYDVQIIIIIIINLNSLFTYLSHTQLKTRKSIPLSFIKIYTIIRELSATPFIHPGFVWR